MAWQDLTTAEVTAFQCVQDWLDEVAIRRTGSSGTQHVYLRQLADYCNWRQKTPGELLAEDKPYRVGKKMTIAERNVTKYFQYLIKEKPVERGKRKGQKGLDRSTAVSIYGHLRSFFRYNEIVFYGKTPGGGSKAKASISLSPDKLRAVVEAADLREKFAMCGLACTGMRPSDFVLLTYGDIRKDFEAGELRLYIEKESVKEDLMFGVFLNRQATRYLRMMLEERRQNGEEITDDSPLIAHTYGDMTGPISTDQLARIVNGAGERVGMYLTPKLFRKNFRTLASPKIGRDATCKMAAWTIPGVGGHYFLPPRSKCLEFYRQIEPLFTYEEVMSEEDRRVQNLIDFAISQGLPLARAEQIRQVFRKKRLSPEEVAKMLRTELRQVGSETGGLPADKVMSKMLANVIVDALKEARKQLTEEN